ncbi:aldo/keto reductase [Saccharopolyspora flava]|uniref:Predicted oxidoreductase n=1 Tax=Saccharopolyspora flava TaxID=95161 RepID=A0A1I6TKK4_9PSEU|nr:aldo/keto reductase [Saccharopolyspora flava]SFS89680.1 Predicted oxidoreductase [Saccharopolyspora flava]
MDERRLGTGGPALSVIGLGCNNFGMKLELEDSRAVLEAALEAGITHLDTAEMYGGGRSEEIIGECLGSRRDDVVIATKFTPRPKDETYRPGALAERIREACEGSLRRLRTDRIDVYYQHYPDAEAPEDEALEALDELVRAGKVLHVASSNVSAQQIARSQEISQERSWTRFTGTQIEWNLLHREVEAEVVPAARRNGLGVVPYFPLASGLLTGKYRKGAAFPEGSRFDKLSALADRVVSDENFDAVERLTAFAEERGHTILELAVAWLLAQRDVTSVITGATSPDQVRANVAAAGWHLSADDLAALPA